MVDPWKPILGFEDSFNQSAAALFVRDHWHYSIYISAFYVVSIFGIQRFMKDRPKYSLRGPLMVWSLLLALFSILGFLITGLHHWPYLIVNGWKRSVCDSIIVEGQGGLWSFLFCLSKAPELVDTYFIVFRKQKLIFLHWYHHITVFIYCWYNYSSITAPQQWFITLNYFVHSIMYSYYAIRASGIYRPPVWINIVITSLQLLQMAIGVWVNVYVFINMAVDPTWHCDGLVETTYSYVYLAFVMYSSYLVLFVHFFYCSYVSKKKPAKVVGKPLENGVGFANGTKKGSNGYVLMDKPYLNGQWNNNIGTYSSHLNRRKANGSS